MQILIKEDQFNRIFLTENRESKNMSIARNVVRQHNPKANPMQVLNAVRSDIPASRLNQCQFLPGVVRMYLQGQISNGATIGNLNQTLKILATAHAGEYNQDLNGMSAEELISRFKAAVRDDVEQKKASNAKKQYSGKTDYKVVLIPDAETASKYKEYVTWCVCSNPDMYESYTHDGMGVFYFLLKNGFEDVIDKIGPHCPLDEYGLSMIAVSINEDGSINTVTCRWNHSNGGNDNIMTDEQLSELLGQDVYQVLKPVHVEILADNKLCRIIKKGDKIKMLDKTCNIYVGFDKYGYANIGNGYQDLRGKVNMKGELVVPRKYFSANEVESDGCFIAQLYGTGLVNTKGDEIIKPKDSDLSYISKTSNAGTRLYKDVNGHYGLINVRLGKNIELGIYKSISFGNDNKWRVIDYDGNVGLLNDDLTVAIEPGEKYDWIDYCEEIDNIPFRIVIGYNDKYGIIDKDLREVVPLEYNNIMEPEPDRKSFRLIKKFNDGRKKGYFTIKDGQYIIEWDDGDVETLGSI